MTALTCPACGNGATAGMRYCEQCGTPLADNTTRYLSAAAHIDAEYCTSVLDEFTVEPVRSVPPSPGADSAAVLRDALAARTRRRIRDAALLTLLVIFTFLHPGLFVLWLGVAVTVRLGTGLRSGERSSGATAAIVAAVLGVAGAVYLLAASYVDATLSSLGPGGFGQVGNGSGEALGVVLLSFLMLAVCLADSCAVQWLVRSCFRRERFVADPRGQRSGLELRLRTLGTGVREPELDRIAQADRDASADDTAAVVVHRGFDPFVGAGTVTEHEGIAVTLEPGRDADRPPEQVEVLGLHHHISMAMVELRTATSLGPGGRLADLEIREQVMVPAEELVTHPTTAPARLVLPSRDGPPSPSIDLQSARALAVDPAEWARYFRCYRIETWDRDLTSSTYVHIGTDQKTLYFERLHCVLMPLAERFREIDRPLSDLVVLGRAVTSLFLLPATLLDRFRGFVGKQPISQRPGEVVPDRYGAAHSLRELAADTGRFRNYFQLADAERYQNVIDRILLRSIVEYLESRGYSAVEFSRAFSQTIYDYRGADIANSAIGPNARTSNRGGPGPRDNGGRTPAKAKG